MGRWENKIIQTNGSTCCYPCIMLAMLFFLLPFDKPPDPERQEAVSKPTHDPTNIEELYQAYRYFNLPLPPKGSFLAKKTERRASRNSGGKVEFELQDFLFLVKADDPKFEKLKKYRITPTSMDLKSYQTPPYKMSINSWMYSREWLLFAAQAHHLGWKEAEEYGFKEGMEDTELAEGKTPILNFLKESAWEYHRKRLFEPTANRREVLAELKKTFNESNPPFYQNQIEFDRNLTLTIQRQWNRKGSAEELINGLVTGESTSNELFAMGFDAVPALIQHITDERLTKTTKSYAFMNSFGSYNVSVSSICLNILNQISSRETDRFDNNEIADFSQSQYLILQAKQADEWFREAKLMGEEKWCMNNVHFFSKEDNRVYIDHGILNLIQTKYPQNLESIAQKCLAHQQFPQLLLKSIVSSRLSKKDKDRFVSKAMTMTSTERWLDIVDAYSWYDVEQSRIQLRHYLKEIIAKKLPLKDGDDYQVKSLLTLLDELKDPECWRLFRTYLPKAEVDTRRYMTDYRFHTYRDHSDDNISVKNQSERLKCILTLINDDSQIPIDPNQFPGFVYGNGYLALKIGDLAALKIAEELDYEIPWKLERTQDEWKTVRADAKAKAEIAIKQKE